MIFDELFQWVASVPFLGYLPAIFAGLAIAVGTFALSKLVVRTRPEVDSMEWRDPPPVLFKIFKPLVRLFATDVRSLMRDEYYKSLHQKLSAAGQNYAILPHEFTTLKLICMVVGGIVSVVVYKIDQDLGPEALIFLASTVPVGFFYPDIWLADKVGARRRAVAKEFPFLLDLLVLSMRAGLNYSTSLGQAIASLPTGPVREEFAKLLRETRAGKSRREALLDLAERMNIDSVNNFVAAVNQADETGGEIVDVLTAQAEQKRVERFNHAEEVANKAPVKMLIPMMAFLFPIIFMLLAFVVIVKLAEIDMLPTSMLVLLAS
ncbi:hypothetical protein A9Q99_04390 [Gammaproteobacteria bacterium 45_16_T64]|nr:hypothetical protein A9Q99_04390 [Gammaproteobacteria bacterium 45_16_T64]